MREQLAGVAWRGVSDTETLLASFEKWSVEGTVKKLVGMFAFAVWDNLEKGSSFMSHIPEHRLSQNQLSSKEQIVGGFLNSIESFDHIHFLLDIS